MNPTTRVNRPAPLKNIAAFTTLVERMVSRDPDLPGLACFYGPSGWGKTKSAIYGAVRSQAAYIECGQYTSARSLLRNLLTELGEARPRGSIEEMKAQVILRMVAAPQRPVIVDEAHFVARQRFCDLLREMSDKSGAPVIMIGEETLPGHIAQFERVHNRVLEWLPAQPCDADDFALLAAHRCRDVRIAPDLAEAILTLTKGNTRRIVVNLDRVVEAARAAGAREIDLDTFGGPSRIYINATPDVRRYA